jgi:acyl-CoA synthetase (AMP-forming)/AMP-acid ligase II
MDFLVHHLLRASAGRVPDNDALVHTDHRMTYAQVWRRTAGLARGLREAGVARLDRVGVVLPPSLPLAVSFFGVSRAGGVWVPIHHTLLPDQVAHIIGDCQMRGLILDADRFVRMETMLRGCPALEFVVIVGGGDARRGALARYDYDALVDGPGVADTDDIAIDRDLAAILYTSGSTGLPKGVMLSHANIVAGASIVSDYLGITKADRILAVLPFSFDAGLNQLTTAIQRGSTCVLTTFLFAREIVATLAKERITGLAGVPSLWSLLAQPSSMLHARRLPDLRYVTNTGGALSLTTLARLRELLPGTRIFLMYGLTEAFRSTYLPPDELDRRPTSMGKAIPNTEILVVDETGRPCGPGEIGELVHRGPTVSLGYWGHQELTDRVLRPHPLAPAGLGPAEKVCYSGDLVKTDEEGFLYFVGRRGSCGPVRIAVRVNPSADVGGGGLRMGGGPAPFGIDEEQLEATLDALVAEPSVVGVHLYVGTQILDPGLLIAQYRAGMETARRLAVRLARPLSTIDFGGGLGVPYFDHEQRLDLGQLQRGLASLMDAVAADPGLAGARLVLEPGRFLIAEAGIYLARVSDVKVSRGKTFVITDGGMHHHLAASGNLGQTIKRNFPVAVVTKLDQTRSETVDVVGPLCTPLDVLARGVRLPPVDVADLIGVFQSGAYARAASPLGFLSRPSPPEVLIVDGRDRVIRRRGRDEDYLRDQERPAVAGRSAARDTRCRR